MFNYVHHKDVWRSKYRDPHIFNLSTRQRLGISLMPLLLYAWGKAPNTHFPGGWADPRASLDDVQKRKLSCPYWESNHTLDYTPALMCVCVWASVCVCVCIYIHIYIHIHIYIYIYTQVYITIGIVNMSIFKYKALLY